MKSFATMVMFVLMSVTAYAADVDGTWTGTAAAPTGDVPVTFTFKSDGAKLTGSTMSPDGTTIPVMDGKIDGSTITFTVTFDFGGMPFVLPYKGVVSSDQIKMSADVGGAPIEMLLKKSKAVAALDGTWAGTVGGPQGEFPVSFTFKADGARLTGSTVGFDGTPVPIKDGKIDGSNISYTVSIDFGGMPFDMTYKGVVASDEIKMSGDAFGMPFDFVLKKAK
jgi:hypothetical protein